VASISASDRRTWCCTRLSVVMFATAYTSSSAAVIIWVSVLGNVILVQIALLPTSCIKYYWWWWNNVSRSSQLTGVPWSIFHSNRSFALCQSASHLFVAACWAPFRCTRNCLHCVVVILSATYTWGSSAAQNLWIISYHNWRDSIANYSSTFMCEDFKMFCSW